MATYKEIAPTIFNKITRTKIESHFSIPDNTPMPIKKLPITEEKIEALIDIYLDPHGIEKRNGLRKVAKEVGLTYRQCVTILNEIKAIKREWDINNQEEE